MLIIAPHEQYFHPYHKRALWGWDRENFLPGRHPGIYMIEGIRICYESRVPEYFRELFNAQVPIACVSVCDNSETEDRERYETLKAHFVTRAVENAMFVISSNTISKYQTAPTAVIDPDGRILEIAPPHEEYLVWVDVENIPLTFGRTGSIHHSRALRNMIAGASFLPK